MKLERVQRIVTDVLENCEGARKNDIILIAKVIKEVYPETEWMNYRTAMVYLCEKNFSFEGVTRARRKVQHDRPELKDELTAEARKAQIEKYLDFARGDNDYEG